MNVDTTIIGDFVVTSYGGRHFTMFHRDAHRAVDITRLEFDLVRSEQSEDRCIKVYSNHNVYL